MELKGIVSMITGAGSGIGRATSITFAREGAKIIVVDVDKVAGKQTVNMITEQGGEAFYHQADISKAEQVENAVDKAIKKWGSIDNLINNAGIMSMNRLIDTPEQEWDRVLDVNLKGVFLCMKYVIPHMIERKNGTIVNISSANGLVGAENIRLRSV